MWKNEHPQDCVQYKQTHNCSCTNKLYKYKRGHFFRKLSFTDKFFHKKRSVKRLHIKSPNLSLVHIAFERMSSDIKSKLGESPQKISLKNGKNH